MVIRPLSLAILTLALLLPEGAAADPATRIIVKREPGLSAAERADVRADAGVRLIRTLTLPHTEVVTTTDPRDALATLRRDDDVVYAEFDRIRTVLATGADPDMDLQWGLDNLSDADINAVEAWRIDIAPGGAKATGSGQQIAVVDTGVDVDHPDLFGKVTDTESFVAPRGGDVSDSHGHGTHVTGTIAAFHWNAEGIAGVAPDATIMALRALSAPGSGRDSEIAEAFRYAGQRGVRIVNASLGGPGASQTLRDAIKAYPATLFVVGAGNGDQETGDDNDAKPIYPCNTPEPNVLCVGASTPTDSVATWSNFGSRSVDVFAPGESIRSTLPTLPGAATGVYGWKDGTSMATPHVAATAGLVLQAAPGLTAKQLKEVLLASADVKPGFERSVSGARLDAEAAVNLALARTALPDADRDGWTDAADACPGGPADDTYDGCVSDHDWDGVSDAIDNCDLTPTADQTDSDGDGRGNACDSTPRGHNNDGDHLWQIDDACPDDYGTLSNGCPAPPPPTQPTPQPAPPAPPDSDRDGRYDGSDACALEYAITNDGCPLPQVASLTAKVRKRGSTRSVTVAVGTTRLAILRVTIERRKGGRWVRVTRQKLVTVGNRATVTGRRVAAGRYRVRVSISTSAGTGGLVTKGFRVR